MLFMGDVLSDILEIIVNIVKRLGVWLFQTLIESVFEALAELVFWIIERQHAFFHRFTRTKWLSVPLTLFAFSVLVGTPLAVMVGVFRSLGGV